MTDGVALKSMANRRVVTLDAGDLLLASNVAALATICCQIELSPDDDSDGWHADLTDIEILRARGILIVGADIAPAIAAGKASINFAKIEEPT